MIERVPPPPPPPSPASGEGVRGEYRKTGILAPLNGKPVNGNGAAAAGHLAWLELDRGALVHNLGAIRRVLQPETKVMAVVKANAYGHGAFMTAQELVARGVEALGVATVQEGLVLRTAGVSVPILVLGCPLPEQYESAIRADLELMVSHSSQIDPLHHLAIRLRRSLRVHLKVDTGLGRLGVEPTEAVDTAWNIRHREELELVGLCSHFATAEQEDSTFLQYQFNLLQRIYRYLRPFLPRIEVHIANSAAILSHPATQAHMVRPGIALYGAFPAPELRPVLSLKSRVVQVREVPAGRSVGYGRSYTTDAPARLAILPLGYADGVPRLLSNLQPVLIRGCRCPIVGNISMDQCTVDVADLPVAVGDEVVLIGRQGEDEIRAGEWAVHCRTIPYEILCGFGTRLARVTI